MNEKIYSFKYQNSAKLNSPYDKDNRSVYHLWIDIDQIPVGMPAEVNPRDVTTKTNVYKRIREGLFDSTQSFFVNNRGILISAKNIEIDTLSKTIKLNLGEDVYKYGVLDGGHTYHAIVQNRKKLDPEVKQYVHLEIMTNVLEIDELAGARNTSVQVSDKAIAELADKFEFVKKSIENEPYKNHIAYRENENKRLDTVDLVRLMFAFNVFKFKDDNPQPTQAYSGKAQVLKDYLTNFDNKDQPNNYEYIAKLLPKITKLYDIIELEMEEAYRDYKPKGVFGKIKGIDVKEKGTLTKYYQNKTRYQITQGFIFPIISAFRALVQKNPDNTLEWSVDPLKVWKKTRGKLVNNTLEMSNQLGKNPQSTGKSSALWLQNYDAVNTSKLQAQLEELQEKEKSL